MIEESDREVRDLGAANQWGSTYVVRQDPRHRCSQPSRPARHDPSLKASKETIFSNSTSQHPLSRPCHGCRVVVSVEREVHGRDLGS